MVAFLFGAVDGACCRAAQVADACTHDHQRYRVPRQRQSGIRYPAHFVARVLDCWWGDSC
ncbi:MAG: hypothetical protein DMG96_02725 [Acidobacteria bacterium]|nr:MAG: hypothetical protein DMG96_02725 [Acidobacteriota bacterium]